MRFDAQALYELLPAIYRIRDLERGEPLRRLLSVIAEPVGELEANQDQMYDDLFIETCADWVVPYIGDLIGHRPLHRGKPGAGSRRAEVANTIRFRRRKGTATMLEQLARDVTGWHARVVEFFEWLAWNQYMNHTRTNPLRGGTVDLHDHQACERITYADGAFDTSAHFVDVRDPARAGGRYGVSKIGLFLWRVNAYSIVRGDAREDGPGRYRFNPLGFDTPLFNLPQDEPEITHLAAEINVPGPLRRRPVYDELEALRGAIAADATERPVVQFGAAPVLEITINDEMKPVPPEEVMICNLETWDPPPGSRDYPDGDGNPVPRMIRVAVDPELGRLTVPAGAIIEGVRVSYAYGFAADLGGGPYNRRESVTAAVDDEITWQVGVSRDVPPLADEIVPTLEAAIKRWNDQPAGTVGAIAILDNHTYAENLVGATKVTIKKGSRLLIVAASWPKMETRTGEERRDPSALTRNELRPHLLGNLSVEGAGPPGDTGQLLLDGLLIEGTVTVLVGHLGALTLSHCTVVPGKGIVVKSSSTAGQDRNDDLELTIDHCICGHIDIDESSTALRIADSIVSSGPDGDPAEPVIVAPAAALVIESGTIFGTVEIRHLEASNCLFTGLVTAERRQVGCVRFSYVPPASTVPRRYRCQPELEIATRIAGAEATAGAKVDLTIRDRVRREVANWMIPSFTTTEYGLPGFAQLRLTAPVQLRAGADDDAEMGAFHDLYQPQREANLRVRLDEYLRLGLTAGIYYAS